MSQSFLKQLDRVAGAAHRQAGLTAIAWLVGALIGAALLLVAVDFAGRFTDPGMRWLLTGLFIAVNATVFLRVREQYRRHYATRLSVAREVEQRNPSLGSRLASAVEFVEQETSDPTAGSAELRRAVVLEASTQSEGLNFGEVIDRRPLRRASTVVLGAAALAALFALLAWPTFSLGLQRLAAPWADLDWPRRHVLELVEPVNSIAAGAKFEIAAIDRNGRLPDDIQIEYRYDATGNAPARTESQAMLLVGDQAVVAREDVQEPFAYRVIGGDDQTMEWLRLEVHDPPRVEQYEIHKAPPTYTGLPEATQAGGALTVIEGTRLTLAGQASEPLLEAKLKITDVDPMELQIVGEQLEFMLPQDGWVAMAAKDQQSVQGDYQIVLKNKRGLTGYSDLAPYRVLSDQPPKVQWTDASEDQFVTTRALVPLYASIEDDLAIARAELRWRVLSIQEESDTKDVATLSKPLYTGPQTPPARESFDGADRMSIEEDWDLAELSLEAGVRLDLILAAFDYKPLEGTVELPRRIFLVTDEEFEQRFADKQSQLLAEVQRALDIQREAQQAASELGADLQSAESIDRALLDRMTSLTYAQRQATDAVDDPQSGAAALAQRLVSELQRNRLERPELLDQLTSAQRGLAGLANGAMPDAGRAAAAARREANRGASPSEAAAPLAQAQQFQTEAVERLEQIAEQLTGWADYQRFAREVAELRTKQEQLAAKAAREAVGANGGPLSESAKRATQGKLVAEQAETRRRFEALRQAMQKLLDSTAEESQSAANAVADALDEAAESDISGGMRDASRDLALGRMGAAAASQQQAAAGLGKMLEALRQRANADPEELVKRLREAQKKLAEMQQQANQLAKQSRPRDDAQELSRQAGRMSRQLERLTASQAAGSAQQASQSLGQGGAADSPPSPQQLAQAEQSLNEAQQQVEQRIKELQDQKMQRVLDRLEAKMPDFIARQQKLLDKTLKLEQASTPNSLRREAQVRRAAQGLAGDQEMLQNEIALAADEVAKRAVFELALRGVETEMAAAVQGLAATRLGRETQQREYSALQRLKHVAEVLRENRDLQQQQQQGGGEGGGGGGQPPPSPIDVAELKMLRLMQLDLLSRTDAYEADAAEARRRQPELPPRWGEAGRRLATEQARLVELALEMAARNNDPEAQSDDPVDDDPETSPQ